MRKIFMIVLLTSLAACSSGPERCIDGKIYHESSPGIYKEYGDQNCVNVPASTPLEVEPEQPQAAS